MAAPSSIVRRLNEVATAYAVFERDQVLTETQLNSVTEYLDDQARLTRTQLLGVGIVGGLWPSFDKARVVVAKGVGVTCDGDLLGLASDTVFDRWLDYDAAAPAYDRFYVGDARLPLIELLAVGDPRDGQPVAELAERLPAMIVIAYMESCENDSDLCTGGDCDNRGRTASNTQRLLLVDGELGRQGGLAAALSSGASIARRLPRLRATRVDLGTGADAKVDVSSAERFAARYRAAAEASFKALHAAVGTLLEQVGEVPALALPSPAGWPAALVQRLASLPHTVAGIQYLHAHAKDLIAVWNDLRAALYADDGVLCPAADAFPKHLLLGTLADPSVDRCAAYAAPWLAGGNARRQRVALLMRRFAALLDNFALPGAPLPKITPSRRENAALDERAIPIYYRADATLRELWNETRRQRGESEDNPGYHWTPEAGRASPTGQPSLRDPFVDDLGACDFYRIEGCLGLKADVAEIAVEKLIRQRNLPLAVLSALAHNDRRLVIRGPLFKKTSLHSLHYLLRQDVASHLKDNIAYSDLLAKRFVADQAWVPVQPGKPSASDTVAAAKRELEGAEGKLVGAGKPLSARTYKSFQSVGKAWSEPLAAAVLNTAKARTTIGDIVRTDVVSPVDTLSGSKSHLWVDWLDRIIDHRSEANKERLLLSNLLDEHPGLEHAGGAVPGGTFVLVYNDAGVVIGDLALPYWIDDNDESDFDEPELTLPDIRARLPDDLLPIRVIKPLRIDLAEFKATEIAPEIKIQSNYGKFFNESLESLGKALKNAREVSGAAGSAAGAGKASKDPYLQRLLNNVELQKEQLRGMQEIENDDRQPQAVRDKAAEQAKQYQIQLADSVSETVQYFAVDADESVRFEADKAVVYENVGQAITLISDQQAASKLQGKLQGTDAAASQVSVGSSALVANQIMVNAGLRQR